MAQEWPNLMAPAKCSSREGNADHGHELEGNDRQWILTGASVVVLQTAFAFIESLEYTEGKIGWN